MNTTPASPVEARTTRSATQRNSTNNDPSRRLSYVLRHNPASVGLTLDDAGWVNVDDLLAGLADAGVSLTRTDLDEAVRSSDKQRFAFDESGTRIRANQGHSVHVELGLAPATPPAVLFHGTVDEFLPSIWEQGLTRRSRHHVHLSPHQETARIVAARRGTPRILTVDAAQMASDGFVFFQSANGVWLTDAVPAHYLGVLPD